MPELTEQTAFAELKLGARERASETDDAFSALVERQSRFLFRVAYAVLRNTHDAEDVVQETFLKLYRSVARREIEDERAFLARAAWRIAIGRRKHTASQQEVPDIAAPSRTVEDELIHADRIAMVHRLIDALPEDLRLPLALSTIDGIRSHEIARIMGLPDGTVRSRMARARTVLKEKLAALTRANYAQRR